MTSNICDEMGVDQIKLYRKLTNNLVAYTQNMLLDSTLPFPIRRDRDDKGRMVVIDASRRITKPRVLFVRPKYTENANGEKYGLSIEAWAEDGENGRVLELVGLESLSTIGEAELLREIKERLRRTNRGALRDLRTADLQIANSTYINGHLNLEASLRRMQESEKVIYDSLLREVISGGLR